MRRSSAVRQCAMLSSTSARRTRRVSMTAGRDLWWHELMAKAAAGCACEEMDAEDLLYILYTSGTTGKPKGLVHTTGGYSVQSYLTAKYVFDLRDDDVYWCTADIGWVTGHSLCGVRAAAERRDGDDVRGRAELSGQRPLLEDHRRPQGEHLLHGADGDPRVHQVGRRVGAQASLGIAAAAGNGGRADQS